MSELLYLYYALFTIIIMNDWPSEVAALCFFKLYRHFHFYMFLNAFYFVLLFFIHYFTGFTFLFLNRCLMFNPRFCGPAQKNIFFFLIIAINSPLVSARKFKNCSNYQIFKFLMATECLMCDVRHILKSKHKSNLKLWPSSNLLYSSSSLKICQKQTVCSVFDL